MLGVLVLTVAAIAGQGEAPAPDPAAVAHFETHVRPLLAEHCWRCHGPEARKGGLRLDSAAGLMQGGDSGPPVVPGKPEESALIEAIRYGSDLKMPPKGRLSDAQVAAVVDWVRRGATWPGDIPAKVGATAAAGRDGPRFSEEERSFWAFRPVDPPTPPEVDDPAWSASPIDRFILAGLREKGLRPALPADRRTLIRRATFDLIGLPPTPEEVAAFLADDAPDAFARLIERLLASPHYGQRWGRHWLDLARYADSNGMDENVAYANAYHYRDYVIDAFNRDTPYDEFVRAQVAGDLLPSDDEPTRHARITATGFLVLGPKMLAEDDPVKMEMDIIDEQVDTVGKVFLGLTVGCARCHDHKFDPIPTADYYGLAGIFKSTRSMANHKVVAMWNERPLARPEERAAIEAHNRLVEEKEKAFQKATAEARAALRREVRDRAGALLLAARDARRAAAFLRPVMGTAGATGAVVREAEDFARGNVIADRENYGRGIGVILNGGPTPNFAEYDLAVEAPGLYQVEIRYAAAEPRPFRVALDGRTLSESCAGAVTGSWTPESQAWTLAGIARLEAGPHTLRIERAEGPIPHLDKVALVPRDPPDGIDPDSLRTADQLAADRGLNPKLVARWSSALERAEFAAGTALGDWVDRAADASELQRALDAISRGVGPGQEGAPPLADLKRVVDDPLGPLALPRPLDGLLAPEAERRLAGLREEVEAARAQSPPVPLVMSVEDQAATDLRVHIRGSHLTLGDPAPRRFLTILAGEDQPAIGGDRSGRRELADWLASPSNPLTARVMVNRLWQWHFGQGLVRSPDNFGRLGEPPTHPGLLDWLARTFVEDGWSIKAMHRRIMLSSSYKMSSRHDPAAAEADPENRLRWRFDRRRLEAEAIRDALLAVSGELDQEMKGSRLPTKNHAYVNSTGSAQSLTLYGTSRRSVYLPVIRSGLYPVLQAFDFADPSTSSGQRMQTTVAPQALFMLNDDLVLRASSAWARRLMARDDLDDAGRVRHAFEAAYARPATDAEVARVLDHLRRIDDFFAARGLDAAERNAAAWRATCQALFAASEFITID